MHIGKVWLVTVALFFAACSQQKKQVWVNKEKGLWYTVEEELSSGDFLLDYVYVNPEAVSGHTGGIAINFRFALIRMNDLMLREVSDLDYDSYRLVAELQMPDGTPLNNAQTIISKDSLKEIVRQEHLFRTSTFAPPEVFFPYRNLGLIQNAHEVMAVVKGYPHQTGQPHKTEPDILLKVRIGIRQPKLYIGQITVEHFAIDGTKKDPHSYDFRLTGSGYPDLCWWLFAGSECVYTSPISKNSLEFSSTSGSKKFVFAEADSVQLKFYDDDELSDHDLIGLWKGSPLELQAAKNMQMESKRFGFLKNCRINAEVQPLFDVEAREASR